MQRRPDSFLDKELFLLLEDEMFRTVSQLGLLYLTDYTESKQVWDCLQQRFAPMEINWSGNFDCKTATRPSEPLVKFPVELPMLADQAYPSWTRLQSSFNL